MPENSHTSLAESYVALQEFVTTARKQLDDHAWGYIVGAAETETTHRRNRQSIEQLALRPSVLNDVSTVNARSELFSRPARLPVVLCPIGGLEAFDEQGALTVASGAAAFGVPMFLSSVSPLGIERVTEAYRSSAATSEQASANLPPVIHQLYARDSATTIDATVAHCADIDNAAFCITVDSAVYSRRERDIVARFRKPWRATGEGDAAKYQASLSWSDIARIRSNYKGCLILKGIATLEDALRALDHGVDCIYVSNHGGRQLDHSEGSFSVLQQVVPAIKDRSSTCQVIVDGGIMRGTDVVKALALGADGVGIGRLFCFALAAAGAGGITRMLELLEIEIHSTLALLGKATLADVDTSCITLLDAMPVDDPLLMAFPLLRAQWPELP